MFRTALVVFFIVSYWGKLAFASGWDFAPINDQQKEANTIVKYADFYRGQTESFIASLQITNWKGDKQDQANFKLFSLGMDQSLTEFILPKRDRGKKMLSVADTLYLYFPSSRTAVRVPYEQRLIGQVSNADLTRIYFSRDYTASLLSREAIAGQVYLVLELIAKTPAAPYHKIIYWIADISYQPFMAKYYTVSGKHFKTARFVVTQMAYDKKPHVSKVVIEDEILKREKTIIELTAVEPAEISPKIFLKQNLYRDLE
ncbi:outer membrane lipoprotein-sorting protein [Candidatus Saganbacteria bacterium]|nr:outer membrane lipoprotein-sorting protein [Candidatus Saganbacteria bacterium]